MRWPFRRQPAPATTDPPGQPTSADAAGPVEPTGPAERPAGAPSGRRAWQTLPPLTPVIAQPRVTVTTPEVTMTRSLLHRPSVPTRDQRPAGRVTGLADVLPALDLQRPATSEPAPRPVRAVPRPIERPTLTAATPEYVGEPREPAEPHRAPAWLRALSSGPVMDPLPGAVMPTSTSASRPVDRPAPRRITPADGTATRRPIRPRGRLGLGAPLGPEAADPDPEPVDGLTSAAPAGIPALPMSTAPTGPNHPDVSLAGSTQTGPTRGRINQAGSTQTGPTRGRINQAGSDQSGVDRAGSGRHGVTRSGLPMTGLTATARPSTAGPPPSALVREVGAAAGVDLDGVMVHRGPKVDRRAEQLGAAAYAVDDGVHLASAAGSEDGAAARALVAHELTHIAQQRRLAGALPDEASPDGADLEAEAIAVEMAVRDGRAVPRLSHPRSSSSPLVTPGTEAGGRGAWSVRDTAGEHHPSSAGRPIGALSHPAMPALVPNGVVRGRVQRRPLDLGYAPAQPAPPQATPEAAAPAAVAAPAATAAAATAPAATGSAQASEKPNEPEKSTAKQRFAAFGGEVGEMVLASWSLDGLDDGHQDGGKGKGAANAKGGASGTGHDAGKGKDASGDSRQERFNRIAGPALDRLNEQRREHGEHDLQQLPPEEEQRIWRQVDQGAGGSAEDSGSGHAKEKPIRNWHDLGDALRDDAVDMIGSSFGMDLSELSHEDKGDAKPGDHKGHDEQHKKIEADDLDLDELGHRLYDRIRSRLRMELLLDRERAGLLSDFR